MTSTNINKVNTITDDKEKEKTNLETDNVYENEIKNIKNETKMNIIKIKTDCENKIRLKDEDIKKMQYENDKMKIERNNDIKKYSNEILRMNKLLMRLISNYKRIFSSTLTPKINFMNYSLKIDEFDKIIKGINQEITYDKFPLLYEYLSKNKQFNSIQPFLYQNVKKVYTPIMSDLEEKNNSSNIDIKKEKPKYNDDINNFFKEKINIEKLIISKEKLQSMSKESLINHILNFNNKIIELKNYLKKNKKDKIELNIEDIDINDKNKDEIINELRKKLDIMNNKFEEQIIRNNKNEIIIGAQNRKIDRLQKESYVLSHNLKHKRQSSSIFTPNKSTLYNSSAIDFNSNLSENITTNKNNYNKSMKKSNSCMTINKSKYKRPLSYKPKKIPENNINKNYTTNKVISREFSSKLKEFQIERENNLINSSLNKK